LTTKDQGVIFERTMKTYPHPKARIRSRFIFLEIASYKRCSRPLCSSQTTTPYHTPRTPGPQRPGTRTIGAARKPETNQHRENPALLPQDPTVCQTPPDNHPPARVPGPPLLRREGKSVLAAGGCRQAPIC
jgi:hypothetical protein